MDIECFEIMVNLFSLSLKSLHLDYSLTSHHDSSVYKYLTNKTLRDFIN